MTDYRWEVDPILPALRCKSKKCQRAYYKGEVASPHKLIPLRVNPPRMRYLNVIWMCDYCKTVKLERDLLR